MVGNVPKTCSAKFDDLMTSTEETKESMISERRGELSTDMAFAFPLMMIVVLLHRLIRIEWLIEASISMGADSFS